NPTIQKDFYDRILALKPKRIIFNPGTENLELMELASSQKIATLEACTLVLLRTSQY
ncbi:MAG TPA: CoA-binding protein, partial [Bacteroidetes bacterium]|nr:CoA-binding protein [Bacteroidota bacterium]